MDNAMQSRRSLRRYRQIGLGVIVSATMVGTIGADWPAFPPANTPVCDPGLPSDFAYRGDPTAGRGLYPDGFNLPSGDLLELLELRNAEIAPIDGFIGIVAIGLSNSHEAFGAFERDVLFRGASVRVTTANLAKAGADIRIKAGQDDGDLFPHCDLWNEAHPLDVQLGRTCEVRHEAFLETIDRRLDAYALDPEQVQVVWFASSIDVPDSELNADDDCTDGLCWRTEIDELEAGMTKLIETTLVERFPNLRVVYLSSRNYGGYQQNGQVILDGNPEPFSYDTVFAVKGVLETHEQRIADAGGPASYDGPALAWGPYLWADGEVFRSCPLAYEPAGGLAWVRDDFSEDAFHPSASGETKVAALLAQFLATDPRTAPWFLGDPAPPAERWIIDPSADTATNGTLVGPFAPAFPLTPGVAGFLKFPLDSIPPGATIVSARLVLRMTEKEESRLLDVARVGSEWDERTPGPDLLAQPLISLAYSHPVSPTTVADRDGSIGIDIRDELERAIAEGDELALRVSAPNPFPASYRTRDYQHPARLAGDPPYLVVVTE